MKRFLLEEGYEGKRAEGNTGSKGKGRREGTKEAVKSESRDEGDERKKRVSGWGKDNSSRMKRRRERRRRRR